MRNEGWILRQNPVSEKYYIRWLSKTGSNFAVWLINNKSEAEILFEVLKGMRVTYPKLREVSPGGDLRLTNDNFWYAIYDIGKANGYELDIGQHYRLLALQYAALERQKQASRRKAAKEYHETLEQIWLGGHYWVQAAGIRYVTNKLSWILSVGEAEVWGFDATRQEIPVISAHLNVDATAKEWEVFMELWSIYYYVHSENHGEYAAFSEANALVEELSKRSWTDLYLELLVTIDPNDGYLIGGI